MIQTETQEYINWEVHSLYVTSVAETLDWSDKVKRLWELSTCSEMALFMRQAPHHQMIFTAQQKQEQFRADSLEWSEKE